MTEDLRRRGVRVRGSLLPEPPPAGDFGLARSGLLAVAVAAKDAEKEAKRERARAMDMLVDLLLERAEVRHLLREAIPYLWICAPSSAALSDTTMMPKDIAQAAEAALGMQPEAGKPWAREYWDQQR